MVYIHSSASVLIMAMLLSLSSSVKRHWSSNMLTTHNGVSDVFLFFFLQAMSYNLRRAVLYDFSENAAQPFENRLCVKALPYISSRSFLSLGFQLPSRPKVMLVTKRVPNSYVI